MNNSKLIFGGQAVIEVVEASKTISKVFIQLDINYNSGERLDLDILKFKNSLFLCSHPKTQQTYTL